MRGKAFSAPSVSLLSTAEISGSRTGYAAGATDAMPGLAGLEGRPQRAARLDAPANTSASWAGAKPSATPWWLWWNLLSADAPLVAVVWAAVLARAAGAHLSWPEGCALFLSVWVIYTSDRLLDGWRGGSDGALRERHLFCRRHRLALGSLICASVAAVLFLAAQGLRARETNAGLALGAVLVLYMACIHASNGRMIWPLPKELSVGLLFACGTTLPLWSRDLRFPSCGYLAWISFGLLCSLNCLSIECWENHRENERRKGIADPFVRWAEQRIDGIAVILGAGALAASFARNAGGDYQCIWLAICVAALLILVLNRARADLSTSALRVLADTAVLVPALILLMR